MEYFLNGNFSDSRDAVVSVEDHGFLYGDGVYETLRTYFGRVFQPDVHVRRLFDSAKFLGMRLPWKKSEVVARISELVERNGMVRSFPSDGSRGVVVRTRAGLKESDQFRIRVTVTRGANSFDFTTTKKPTIVISCQKLDPLPRKVYEKGISVIVFHGERVFPEAKTTDMVPAILARREMARKKVDEAFFMNKKGFVTEGTITNVFIVKKGKLTTPKDDILAGTTRDIVLNGASCFMPVELGNIRIRDVFSADECFCTNVLKGIVPVTVADGRKIGSGKPGEWTGKISEMFEEFVERKTSS